MSNELEKLKVILKKDKWKTEEEERQFFCLLYIVINNWEGPIPHHQDLFKPEKVERLLTKCVKYNEPETLIEFVIETRYRDRPVLSICGKPLLRRTTPLHHAARRKIPRNLIKKLFIIYDQFDVNYTDETGLTHFHVACMFDFVYAIQKFLEFGLDPNFRSKKIRKSPLQLALSEKQQGIVRFLIQRSGVDPNSADADGSTHLHAICKKPENYDLAEMFFEICDNLNKTVLVNAQDKFGNTPLLSALLTDHHKPELVEMLLRRGAYVNLANKNGLMPLHIMCDTNGYDGIMSGLDVRIHQSLQADARDRFGNTLLQLALTRRNRNLAELLLKNGADPNLTNVKGLTPLQIICKGDHDNDLAEMFFKVNNDRNQTVNIDVQDELGNTPLHLAVQQGNKKKVLGSLLENGANPNLVNAEGLAALHVIFMKNYDEGCITKFFEVTKKVNQLVQVDARDRQGRTPLRLAVSNLWPKATNLLLNRGADLSDFVFPTRSEFDEQFELYKSHKSRAMEHGFRLKLEITFNIVSVIQNLEDEGYKLTLSDALTIMAFSTEHGLSDMPSNFDDSLLKDESFVRKAKTLNIKQNLTLYDLIQLRFNEAAKHKFTFFDLLNTRYSLKSVDENVRELLEAKICPILLRRFFLYSALDSFMQLTSYRLPNLCCEMILDGLRNTNLHNICLAAADQSS